MRNLIKIGMILFFALAQTSANADDNNGETKPIKILIGTSNLAPYITDIILPNFSTDIKDGNEITEIIKGLAASKKVKVTVVAPMMLGIYKNMQKYDIRSTGTYITVPMPFGEDGKSIDVQVLLYETTTDYGVKVIFVGEPYESGLFKQVEQNELSNVQNTLKKYSFLSKAILEVAKLNDYDVIHTFRWTTSMVPWYKKYWERYASITAKTEHSFFSSDAMAFNADMAADTDNKKILQIEEKYYNAFVDGSIASHNKIRFQKFASAANLKTDMIYPDINDAILEELLLSYQHLSTGEDIVDIRLNELATYSLTENANVKAYIAQNPSKFGNKKFLDALVTRIENDEYLPAKKSLCSQATMIVTALSDSDYTTDQALYSRILALPKTIEDAVEDQQRSNIMSYLKTKGIETKTDAISYFEKNFSEILYYAKEGDNLDKISASKEDMLALTAVYLFTFRDYGAFFTPESYTMFMGTTKNESLDGLLNYLDGSVSPIFKFYKALAAALIIANSANENISKYYVQGAEKSVPTNFMDLVEGTSLGRDFAGLVVKDRADVEFLYLTGALKNLLPEKTDVTTKLNTLEDILKK